MDAMALAARLIIDGVIVIPDVLVGEELEAIDAAFERRAAELGKRHMNWEEISHEAGLVNYIAHPRLMAVVDAFGTLMGEPMVFCNSSGARDVYTPERDANKSPVDPKNLRKAPVGWHDDVVGMRNPQAEILPTALTTLIYLDETFADNGAYCAAIGSHHLARRTPEGKPILASADVVLSACDLKPLPVKPGSVIMHRSHHWHGVVTPQQRRRVMLQTFCARSTYNLQEGHTQLDDETLALLPAERQQHIMSYAKA